MKNLSLILMLIANTLISCGKIDNDLKKENLKGNIVSVKTTKYIVTEKFGEPVKGKIDCFDLDICSTITKYNDLGNEIEFTDYDSYGIGFITKILYTEKNQKIEQNRYTPVEGKRVMQFKFKYDLNGNCIEESSDAGYLVKRQYDNQNNLIKEFTKDWQTKKIEETTFFYDENNRIITEKYSQGKTEYTYYDDENTKDVMFYDKDGKEVYRGSYKYEYDQYKNWIAQIAYQDGAAVAYIERIIEYKN
jgi:hypothetical protein